jgi:hypothetical protein
MGAASTTSNGPTAKAIRYVGSGGVAANATRVEPPSDVVFAAAPLEMATFPLGTTRVTSNGVLKEGSSKHGKARRASTGSNWVNT